MDIKEIPREEPERYSVRTDIQAALPNLVLALGYGLAAFSGTPLPFLDKQWLGRATGVEFLAIHSFPFMMLIAASRPADEQARKCRQAAFWGLFSLYILVALKMGGLSIAVTFVSLTAATYFGYLLRRTSPGAIGQLVIRWASSFLVFMIAASAARLPESVDEWPDHEGVFVFGLAYFLVLGVLELSGAYHSRPALTIIRRFREQLKQERDKQSR